MPWYAWIILLLTVAGGAAIGIAAALRRRREGGLLPGLHRWPEGSVPFIIMLDTSIVPSKPLEEAIAWAADFWRSQVHEKLFTRYGDIDSPGKTVPVMPLDALVIAEGQEPCSNRFGYTNLIQSKGELFSAAVYIDIERARHMDLRDLRRAMAHELGHVLGLEHDDDHPESVMYPKIPAKPDPIVTDSDKTVLLALYG